MKHISTLATRAVLLGAVIATTLVSTAWAVDPIPSEVSWHDIRPFRGNWHINAIMKFGENEREVEFYLMVMDVDGKAGALVDSTQQSEPIPVDKITETETGLDFFFEMQFGDNSFPMIIHAQEEEERLVGTINDVNGLFNLTFEGIETDDIVQGQRPNPTSTRFSVGTQKYKINFSDLKAEGEDYSKLSALADGEVFKFVGGRATKLFTDTDLTFGDLVAKAENAAPEYPGVYSLWLKRVGDGWNLVFNEECDIWGTQHRDQADLGEVALAHNTLVEPQAFFVMEMNKVSNTNGTLRIAWGEHEWTTDFTIGQ